MNLTKAMELEDSMWKAAKNRDAEGFLKVVSPKAIMVCGGYRCYGEEYAEIIRSFDCKSYDMDCFEIVNEDGNSFQVHYILKMEVENIQNSDLGGNFHITTTWNFIDGNWMVVFNMDQRVK